MQKLLATALLAFTTLPALASPKVHRYVETCWVLNKPTTCVVVETRTRNGSLNTRNIFNDQYSYTMKQSWRDGEGFMTWDSWSNRTYKYYYQGVAEYTSKVTPHLIIMNVSWD